MTFGFYQMGRKMKEQNTKPGMLSTERILLVKLKEKSYYINYSCIYTNSTTNRRNLTEHWIMPRLNVKQKITIIMEDLNAKVGKE